MKKSCHPASRDGGALLPPVTYQGGKHRLAEQLVRLMGLGPADRFYDLCCGGGSVSIAAVVAGVPASSIRMIDCGPWGMFWQQIGSGDVDLERLRALCEAIPKDLRQVKGFMKELFSVTPGLDPVPEFLVLQAAAFGGTPVRLIDGRWKAGGWRDYWLPTATSNRRSPVNPMMPLPHTLYERVVRLADAMLGVLAECSDVRAITVQPGSVVYIDPPYTGTAGYTDSFDVVALARSVQGSRVFVSEAHALSDDAERLAGARAKGGISGKRKVENSIEEWVSRWPA